MLAAPAVLPTPSEIGLLAGVEQLCLHANMLTGRIPEEVADLPISLVFNAANNDVTDAIPAFDVVVSGNFTDPEVGDWITICDRAINLAGNAFTGTIPSSMCVIDSEAYSLLHCDCSLQLCGCSCSCDTGTAAAMAANMTNGGTDMTNATTRLKWRRH